MTYPLNKAVEIVNSQAELARRINDWMEKNKGENPNLKQQHVWKWLNHGSGVPTVPSKYRLAIQEITGGMVTVNDLSHDIFGLPSAKKLA